MQCGCGGTFLVKQIVQGSFIFAKKVKKHSTTVLRNRIFLGFGKNFFRPPLAENFENQKKSAQLFCEFGVEPKLGPQRILEFLQKG
jgi:hypothetical protein